MNAKSAVAAAVTIPNKKEAPSEKGKKIFNILRRIFETIISPHGSSLYTGLQNKDNYVCHNYHACHTDWMLLK